MRELGYVEGKNLTYEIRYADGKINVLAEHGAELVRLKVDLIFTAGAEAVLAAMKATKTIPIVFGTVQDAVASGIVASLARPGGNATGFSALAPDLVRKRLELLKEVAPQIARVALFWNPSSAGSDIGLREAQSAADALKLHVQSLPVTATADLAGAFEAAIAHRTQGIVTAPDPGVNSESSAIVGFAAKHRLPAVYAAPEYLAVGGLMTYAPHYLVIWRRAASLVDRILKGAKPADLPVEQPTTFELAINMKTAKALGIKIPQSVLLRADRVVE